MLMPQRSAPPPPPSRQLTKAVNRRAVHHLLPARPKASLKEELDDVDQIDDEAYVLSALGTDLLSAVLR